MSRSSLVTSCLIFGMSFAYANDRIQCQGPDGVPVDWFFVYKLPDLYGRVNQQYNLYNYITSTTVKEGWKTAVMGLDNKESLLARTLSPLYNEEAKNIRIILYNNHKPGLAKPDCRLSAAKGVVISNEDEGFWIIHSMPAFPDRGSEIDSLTKLNEKGGHMFLCISVQSTQIEFIEQQLDFNEVLAIVTFNFL